MTITASTPTRISLYGGGTDFPQFYKKYGGLCINLAINIRQYIIMSDQPGKDIFPPGGDPEFCYAFLKAYGLMGKVRLECGFDGIIESGIGSSAACAVAMMGCINKWLNLDLNRQQIAECAWEIETKKIKLFGGKQDQYAATFGGLTKYQFLSQTVLLNHYDQETADELSNFLVLFYTGNNRKSATIQNKFKKMSDRQISHLIEIANIAKKADKAILEWDFNKAADLINESFREKIKSNNGVLTPKIEEIYTRALQNGAMAGKILGAGGGGFMVFVVKPIQRNDFISSMQNIGLQHWDFQPDYNGLDVREVSN